MKRPQFSIRLMLLVVALLAAVFAWRSLVNTRERMDRLERLQARLREAESVEYRASVWYEFERKRGPISADVAESLKKAQADVKSLEMQISELSHP